MPPADLSPLNDREYRKLLLALTLDAQRLELLVAITDDRNLQDQLIAAYEADLKAEGITPLRTQYCSDKLNQPFSSSESLIFRLSYCDFSQ